ncbi:MAG TPA: fumarylacetoacetate hydrolase family protein [Bacilli bacterium]|nr:fumarylacetoacetate hydrolase family protein [Bacilli bacterium]
MKTSDGLIKLGLVSRENFWLGEIDRANPDIEKAEIIPEREVKLLPPVLYPPKILCVGLNYARHIEETKLDKPREPLFFAKLSNALAGPSAEFILNDFTYQVDYEGELVVVIGKTGKNIPKKQALDYVWGYTIGNDITDRRLQFSSSQWLRGKSLDLSAPIGPYLVTKDEIDLKEAEIVTRRNQIVVQRAKLSEMLFAIPEIISHISQTMTLEEGDLIFTGSPSGSIIGMPETNQKWLDDGDIVSVTIEPIGTLTTYFKKAI